MYVPFTVSNKSLTGNAEHGTRNFSTNQPKTRNAEHGTFQTSNFKLFKLQSTRTTEHGTRNTELFKLQTLQTFQTSTKWPKLFSYL